MTPSTSPPVPSSPALGWIPVSTATINGPEKQTVFDNILQQISVFIQLIT
jgi:hypothetical protein